MNMKYTKVLGLALAALTFCTCSDEWDNHYNTQQVGDGRSLWETISTDNTLSNFASVIQATGYDKALGSSQVFTVFAPTNDALTAEQAEEWIDVYNQELADNKKDEDNKTIKEFVKNHITLYNKSVSELSNDTIVMLNGKYLKLDADGLDGHNLSLKNSHHTNGILFKVDHQVDYFYNVFEYLATDADLDSLAKFLYSYNEYEFMPELSVPGGIENGQTVYLDSVTVLENELFARIGLINEEDSTYTMLAPTNQVWSKLVEEYENYFNYCDFVQGRDSLKHLNTRMAVVRGTVFSHTANKNWADSAVSVNAVPYNMRKYMYGSADAAYYVYYNTMAADGIFNGAIEKECSNGRVMKADTWNIDKTQSFLQNVIMEGEARNSQAKVDEVKTVTPLQSTYVASTHPFYNKISNNGFTEIVPTAANARPQVWFYIDNVLSNLAYDIQLVLVPTWTGDLTSAGVAETVKPNFMSVKLWSLKQDAVDNSIENEENWNVEQMLRNYETNFLREGVDTTYITMDTITVASNYTFPTCSYGLETPQVMLEIQGLGIAALKKYQGNIRVDAIILKPHEEENSVVE